LALLVSIVTYAGAALALAGAVSLLRPLHVLRIRSRRAALALLALSLALLLSGAFWPWPEKRAIGRARLDGFVPAYQFAEFHEARVRASPEAVYDAIRSITADEIRLFRTLTWIRSPRLPWRRSAPSILDPSRHEPILDVATRSGFVWLADQPRELVVGTVVCCGGARVRDAEEFRALTRPGVAKAAMDFRIEALVPDESRVTTETRVFATDAVTRRRFGLYWAFIYPGSSLIRHGWLEAIRRRAEAAPRSDRSDERPAHGA
jgi:hypothetical protein